jgi:monovalent cation/hydrogen antiporter
LEWTFTMENISVIIILLAIVTALAQITDKIRIPYPILLVIAGIAVGIIPGLPRIVLNPDVVFLVFLPPVLYAAAWNTSLPDFVSSARAISLLAFGCVLFTTCLVAITAHYCVPGFAWPESFVLGAIVSPPDAVAASAATRGLGIPRRVMTILEGESLVNDATGLIAYRYAIAVSASGTFILWLAGVNFIYVAGVGVIIGLIVGFIFLWIHKITPDNSLTDTSFTFLTPYTAYLIAEHYHASGVLAVVVCGLFLSRKSSEIFNHQTRLQANFVWQTVIFLLNGIIFILIGLQLPSILGSMAGIPLLDLLWYGTLVSLAAIVARIIWVYPGTYIPRLLSKRIRTTEARPPLRMVTVVAWSGMRGVVSLAAALALPLTVGENIPFPQRDFIIFLSFSVIFATLVLQGLTLPRLIAFLKIRIPESETEEEHLARLKVATAMIEHIEENYSLSLNDTLLNQVKTRYEIRIQQVRKDLKNQRLTDAQINEYQQLRYELVSKERKTLIALRNSGEIGDEVMRRMEYELDLEETRLLLDRVI